MTQAAFPSLLTDCEQTSVQWADLLEEVIERLRHQGVGNRAPRIGDRFPDFALPDAQGRYRMLAKLLEVGPIVLSFNRGGWCPYCREELAGWALQSAELEAGGVRFVSVVPEVDGRIAILRDIVGGRADTLCDIDQGLALQAGLVFRCNADLRRRYLDCGLDLGGLYGSDSWFLTLPATFAIDQTGIVRFAFVDPDFRLRANPAEVIAALVRQGAAHASIATNCADVTHRPR